MQAASIVELVDEQLTTKRDFKEIVITLKSVIRELELRLTIKLSAIVAVGIGIVAVLVKLL